MSQAAVAERYARALYELGVETNQLSQLGDQIRRIAAVYRSSEELRDVLGNPVIPEEKREALLKDLATRLGLGQYAMNAVRLLAARRRLGALPEIGERLLNLTDEKSGVLRATVVSAKALSESYYRQLIAELETATRRKVVLEREEDPSLIAGVVTRIGDHTIDGSLKGRLRAIQRDLIATA